MLKCDRCKKERRSKILKADLEILACCEKYPVKSRKSGNFSQSKKIYPVEKNFFCVMQENILEFRNFSQSKKKFLEIKKAFGDSDTLCYRKRLILFLDHFLKSR